MDETVVTPFADEAASEKVLRLQDAYQGRAMFVKISCRTGEPPVELSHHPELRFRFTPRAREGAPLIANSVSFEVRKSACIRIPSFHRRALSLGLVSHVVLNVSLISNHFPLLSPRFPPGKR